jgi:uncharacterized protein (TIGR02453 family)
MTHFTPDTLAFLDELKAVNNKEWYIEHKAEYEAFVLFPMRSLTEKLCDFMLSIDPAFETKPSRVISRIYRDTRFSKDKSLFRDCMWLTFKRGGKEWQNHPAFYFEISPHGYRYGMGFYEAGRETMDAIRAAIDHDPKDFEAASAFVEASGFELAGDDYKRIIKPHPPHLAKYYQKKSFYLVKNREIDGVLFGESFADELKSEFGKLKEFYLYLSALIAR